MKSHKHILFSVSIIGVLFLAGGHAYAAGTQSGYQLLAEIPTIVAKDADKGITLVDYMKGLFVAVIGLAIVLAVVQLVIGGIEYVAAALPSAKTDARNRILGAIGGLLLILIAWIVLNALNPKLLNVGLNLEKVAIFGGDGGGPGDVTSKKTMCTTTIASCTESCTTHDTPEDCQSAEKAAIALGRPYCGQEKDGDEVCISKSCTTSTHTSPLVCKKACDNWADFFSFDPEIKKQAGHVSGPLSSLLSCMSCNLTKGVGRISSISDSQIANGTKTFEECAANGCSHTAHSCHYGGRTCVGSSYAVDFGDEGNKSALSAAAKNCVSGAWINDEGGHVHISVGNISGCNCDK